MTKLESASVLSYLCVVSVPFELWRASNEPLRCLPKRTWREKSEVQCSVPCSPRCSIIDSALGGKQHRKSRKAKTTCVVTFLPRHDSVVLNEKFMMILCALFLFMFCIPGEEWMLHCTVSGENLCDFSRWKLARRQSSAINLASRATWLAFVHGKKRAKEKSPLAGFARGKLMIDQLISNVASCSIELLKLCFFGSGKRWEAARECFRRLLWLTFHVEVREKVSLLALFPARLWIERP